MPSSEQIVREFCDLMVKRDAQAVRSYFTEDSVYQNTGMPATVGVDDIVADLAGQFGAFPDSYEYKLLNIAANGDVVMTERLDMVGTDDTMGVPVMGTFVLKDGKISRWTDYWDTSLPGKILGGEDVSTLVPQSY